MEPLRTAPSVCKDSFSLCKYIKSSDLHNAYLVSFDVQSLFTNIPVDEVIEIILTKLFPSGPKLGRKTYRYEGFKYLEFKRALEWCLKGNTFIFNGKFYVQTDGIAMGSPLAPILADIFLNHILENKILKSNRSPSNVVFSDSTGSSIYQLVFFTRYVDDILAAFKDHSHVLPFLNFLNSLHPSMNFTVEEEINNSIPFLDILITRESDRVTTKVYRKSTHSGVFTHYLSFVPFRFKRQLIKTLLHRAYELCSSYDLLHAEFERLRVLFMNNGYQRDFIFKIIHEFMTNKFSQYLKREGPKPKELYLRLPFLKDCTNKVANSLRSFTSQSRLGHINYRIFHTYTRVEDKLKFKDRCPEKTNVVYKLNCTKCKQSYIGETERDVMARMKEHESPSNSSQSTSEVARHTFNNPGHTFNTSEPEILSFETNKMKRKVLEALWIQELSPSLNIQVNSYKLNLFEIPTY